MSISKLREVMPANVRIVEVGPRDGLQNESVAIPAADKIAFIEALVAAGIKTVEVTSFVDPRWVPQLADAQDVFRGLHRVEGATYPVLVPNERGLERAIEVGADEIAIFASATETFSQRNLNRSIAEAMEMFRPVAKRALDQGIKVRGYLSMVCGDPWEGQVKISDVVDRANELLALGCYEISLGDTIGVGTAGQVQDLIGATIESGIDLDKIAVHFHDTYGQGLANVLAALQVGVTVVDSSAGGLGGCPFAKSATGNLATEDLVWMLDGLGVHTGIDLRKVAEAAARICKLVGKPLGRAASAVTS